MDLKALLSVALCAAALAACGGGKEAEENVTGRNDAPAEPAANTEPSATINSTDQPADVVATSEGGESVDAVATQSSSGGMERIQAVTLSDGSGNVSYNFESAFTRVAPGWYVNYWGSGTVSWAAGRESRTGYPHGGLAAQWYTVQALPSGGGAHLVYSYPFANGANYTASVWVRSDTATQVELQLRRDVAPWNVFARQRVTVGPTWQQITVNGTYTWAEGGSLRVVPIEIGKTIYIDDAAITKTGSTTTTTTVAPVGGTTLPAAGPAGETLTRVKTSTMDEAFTRFAPGWYYNAFGGTAPGVFEPSRETRSGYFHSGVASQKFQVIDKKGGQVHLITTPGFVKLRTYRVSAWLRADAAREVRVFMRRDDHPYSAFASKTVTANTTWQKVELEGVFLGDSSGSLRFDITDAAGTIWVDDVTIDEVKRNDLAPFSTATIPDTLFGMHVLKLGEHFNWPGVDTRILRLHNTATQWRALETSQNVWDWKRLDMYVEFARQHGAQLVYTMGQTPQWASSTPTLAGLYGLGASGAPRDMNDWRDYVRTLARRYVGRIRHWELWNEPDYGPHWAGTPAQMVEMARIAAEELHAADPQNVLVSPGMTIWQGPNLLNLLLTGGMGNYVDAIGYHFSYSIAPETLVPQIDNVRSLMKSHGIGSKPLWNTEGQFNCDALVLDCATAVPTASQMRSVNARALFIMATRGIANFNFYTYENQSPYHSLVGSDYATVTEAGRTYNEARTWLRGARVVDAYRVGDTIYVLRMNRGTENYVVLWSTQANTVVNLPSTWGVTRSRTLLGADGSVPTNGQITIGPEPLMLRP